MGLFGLLIAVVILILIFVFSFFSNFSPIITPSTPKKIQTEAQQAMDETAEKAKLEQNQIKNIDLH